MSENSQPTPKERQKAIDRDSKVFRNALYKSPPLWEAAAAAFNGDVPNINKSTFFESLNMLVIGKAIPPQQLEHFSQGLQRPEYQEMRDALLATAIAVHSFELIPVLLAKGAHVEGAVRYARAHFNGGAAANTALFAVEHENRALKESFAAAQERIAQLEEMTLKLSRRLEALETPPSEKIDKTRRIPSLSSGR
jgi:hypothetical protein